MTDSECLEVFDMLCKMLEENKVAWLADQLRHEKAGGRLTVKQVDTWVEEPSDRLECNSIDRPSWRRGRPTAFVAQSPYTPRESLHLLIDAIERVIIESAQMEQVLTSTLANDQMPEPLVEYVNDDDAAARHVVSLSRSKERSQTAERLRHLLGQLREEVNNAD